MLISSIRLRESWEIYLSPCSSCSFCFHHGVASCFHGVNLLDYWDDCGHFDLNKMLTEETRENVWELSLHYFSISEDPWVTWKYHCLSFLSVCFEILTFGHSGFVCFPSIDLHCVLPGMFHLQMIILTRLMNSFLFVF